jgi:hypothetical protein
MRKSANAEIRNPDLPSKVYRMRISRDRCSCFDTATWISVQVKPLVAELATG